jgi:hypothetical protein
MALLSVFYNMLHDFFTALISRYYSKKARVICAKAFFMRGTIGAPTARYGVVAGDRHD